MIRKKPISFCRNWVVSAPLEAVRVVVTWVVVSFVGIGLSVVNLLASCRPSERGWGWGWCWCCPGSKKYISASISGETKSLLARGAAEEEVERAATVLSWGKGVPLVRMGGRGDQFWAEWFHRGQAWCDWEKLHQF